VRGCHNVTVATLEAIRGRFPALAFVN
jgi:hypothetical protein